MEAVVTVEAGGAAVVEAAGLLAEPAAADAVEFVLIAEEVVTVTDTAVVVYCG